MLRCAAAIAAAVLALAATARGDDVLEYLESQGLDALAATRLEQLAAASGGDERAQHLDRLGELLARMLDGSADAAETERLLARADRLADELTSTRSDRLRLAAARSRYRAAARIAESIRAGFALDAGAALETLGAQREVLAKLADRAEKRALEIDRRADRERGLGRDLLAEDAERERGLAGQARFLAAWCLVYRGFLSRQPSDSEEAARIFTAILGGRDGRLVPEDVSEDLRSDEAFASAILGLALARARSNGYSEAARWMPLLESSATNAAVREAAPGWRMVAATEARAFEQARSALRALDGRADVANWARVAVSRGVEEGSGDAQARLLVREGLAQLAAAQDLGAVRELATRYGEAILGEDREAFVPRYVRAVRLYGEALEAVARDEKEHGAAQEPARARAAEAAEALGVALAASDAKQFVDASSACRLMRAWSLRGAGDLRAAALAFDEVAEASLGARAEDAARHAIASYDEARRVERDPARRDELDAVVLARIESFLKRFPASEHVPELLVRRVAATAEPTLADVDDLLRVRPEAPEWLASRQQALVALYRAFRGGKESRTETARRYLQVLAELPRDPRNGLPAGDPMVARQALEVVLANEVRDLGIAEAMLAALAAAANDGSFDAAEADEELAYRRLQLAMYADRWADAEIALAPFEKPAATAIWADAALRLAIRGAESRRRGSAPDAPERAGFVATTVRAGDALLAREIVRHGSLAKALEDRANGQFARVVLDARVEQLKAAPSIESGRVGLALADALLPASPRDATLLSHAAACAEAAGDLERAADHLRTLVGGLSPRTAAWYEAKIEQMRVLTALDPVRARAVFAQFRALYPELGPEPYRARLLEIERGLGAASGEGATP